MPVHDWTKVYAGIFHAFHHDWITQLAQALNRGLLPQDYYALPEQMTKDFGPDVLTLRSPVNGSQVDPVMDSNGGVTLATAPPRVRFHEQTDEDHYAAKAKAIVIRHVSEHNVVAMIEIVSPGNKSSRGQLRAFVEKAAALIRAGIHLLVIDLFPPSKRDPQGIHKAIWDEFIEKDFALPPDQPLTLVAYVASETRQAFIEPTAVGAILPDMPLYLKPAAYVPVPLETTYRSAFEGMPAYWRNVLMETATG